MFPGLPEGLVATKLEVRGGLESVDRVDVDDVARLWKAIFAEDVGRRLENFFWRIWGSHHLLHNITGTLVAAIFSKISEGGYIRTTPTQSPRSSRTFGTFHRTRQTERPKTSPESLPSIPSSNGPSLPNHDDAGDAEETETESTVAGKKKLPPRPPPILKKPKSISPPETLPIPELADQIHRGSAADTASRSSLKDSTRPQVQAKSLERPGKTARFSTDEVKSEHFLPIPPKSDVNINDEATEPQGKSKSSSNRRKAAVIASTGASKRRPVMRQRSSQASSSSVSVTTHSQIGVEPVTTGTTAIDTPVRVGSSSPPRFKQQTVPFAETPLEPTRPAAEMTSSSTALKHRITHTHSKIELGGRTMPGHTSFTSLPSILKGSPAAAAPASYQASGMMDMGQQTEFGTDHGSSEHPIPENPSRVDARASGSNTQPLPRTTSQLTILLQRDRTSSGYQ
ncbi:MAG: hypothetical protein L6R38_007370 [Xanthoria sp. 2 TBL-2021]|nr:MAG: hypothetical protein L6R38_007370 [Xanthoria sp. 2 TBL-2021]